ncbi:methyltransferase domain-containing protein [Candidatus Dependentiae bacterium]|nr:methyltransferase domain-containing protein [Candidatus Dependentiae bacterium]
MKINFFEYTKFLACPECRKPIEFISNAYYCNNCKKNYPIIDNIPRFIEIKDDLLSKAKAHWEDSPNFQYEAKSELYTKEYYEEQDKWRKNDIDPFCMKEYKFNEIKDKVILDIGCGSGWVVKQAAKNGAIVIGVDFAEKACISSRKALDTYSLNGLIIQADAQHLPIKDEIIDRIFSIGVLHHIPKTELGIEEAFRTLKKKGTGFISLYGKLFFFNKLIFPVTQFLLKILLKAPKVRDGIQNTTDYDEFYRFMDGATNPIGRWYTNEQLIQMFHKFKILSISKSHFPLRYLNLFGIPLKKLIPKFIHIILENNFGMMRNIQFIKH